MLTSKQRATLRGMANRYETIFQIGKGGINDQLIRQVDETLEVRELIKLRILESAPEDVRTTAEKIAAATGSDVVQVIGSRFILFRKAKKDSNFEMVK